MINSVGGSYSSFEMQMRRPDPSQMASKVFSKLDTKNQGYLEQSDLQAAFEGAAGTSGSGDVSDVFKALDGDGDGKVTKDEFSERLSQLAEQLEGQFQSMRMAHGGMPPGPPPGNGAGPAGGQDDAGFTKDELQEQLSQIGSSSDTRASLLNQIVSNFDQADGDDDGKVSFQEAMSFREASESAARSETSQASAAATNGTAEEQVMRKIMQLMRAYGMEGSTMSANNASSTISISA